MENNESPRSYAATLRTSLEATVSGMKYYFGAERLGKLVMGNKKSYPLVEVVRDIHTLNKDPDVSRATIFLELSTVHRILDIEHITITDSLVWDEERLQKAVDNWIEVIISRYGNALNVFLDHELTQKQREAFEQYLINYLHRFKKEMDWANALDTYFTVILTYLDEHSNKPAPRRTGPLPRIITGDLSK